MKNVIAMTLFFAACAAEIDSEEVADEEVELNTSALALPSCVKSMEARNLTWFKAQYSPTPSCSGTSPEGGTWSCSLSSPPRTWTVTFNGWVNTGNICTAERHVTGSQISPYNFSCRLNKSNGSVSCGKI